MNNYNIIEKDDILIGFTDDLIKHLKNEIIRLLDDDIDNLYMEDMTELIKELKKRNNRELLRISPCQMGGYTIKIIED